MQSLSAYKGFRLCKRIDILFAMEQTSVSLRIDVWLWRARFFRNRALAVAFIAARGVRVSRAGQMRRVTKPAYCVKPGDVLVWVRAGVKYHIRIDDIGKTRANAEMAKTLYTAFDTSDLKKVG